MIIRFKSTSNTFGVPEGMSSLAICPVYDTKLMGHHRASSRIETKLSAAIYEKTLRIIDQSGVVDVTLKSEGKDSSQPVDRTGR